MPHRQAEVFELCAECKARTDWSCPRCGRPLCDVHANFGEPRCAIFGFGLGQWLSDRQYKRLFLAETPKTLAAKRKQAQLISGDDS